MDGIPSALRLRIDTKVYESGGRFVPATAFLPIEVYPSYVGIMPDSTQKWAWEIKLASASSMLPAVVSPFPTPS